MIKLYSNGCESCVLIEKMLMASGLSYVIENNFEVVRKIAQQYNISFAPFAEINGEFYNANGIKKYIYEHREKSNGKTR